MAKKIINIGNQNNDGLGDPIRTAFEKTNQNFNEIYEVLVAPAQVLSAAIATASANRTSAERLLSIRINAASNAASIVSAQVVSVDLKLSAAIDVVSAALSAEVDARLSADRALSVRTDVVSDALSNEISNRRSASAVLETHINSVSASLNSVSAVLESHVNDVSASMRSVSAVLESHVNDVSASLRSVSAVIETHVDTLSNALSNEISNRMSAVDRVSNALSNEISNRMSAVDRVSNAVSIVSAQLVSVDDKLSNAISVLSANFTSTNAVVSNAWSAINRLSNVVSGLGGTNLDALSQAVSVVQEQVSVLSNTVSVMGQNVSAISAQMRSINTVVSATDVILGAYPLNITATTAGTNYLTITTDAAAPNTTSVLYVGMPLAFYGVAESGYTKYGGVTDGTIYYVASIVNSTTFTISATRGGATFALTTTSGSIPTSYMRMLAAANINDLNNFISAVSADLLSAKNNLQSAINVVSNALSVEIVNRVSQGNALSVRIDGISNQVSVTSADLVSAKANLQSAINVVSNALSIETAARISAVDLVVSNALSAEVVNRNSAVNVVSNALSAEIVNRVSAGNALSVRVDTVSNALSAEIVNRISAVNAVSNALSAEIVNRISADTALGVRIDGISNQVSVTSADLVSAKANLLSNINAVSTAVSNEISVRAAASAALEGHINTVSAAVVVASALATTADGHANTVSAAVVTLKTNGPGTSGTWPINVSGTSTSISGFNNPTTAATANTIAYRDSNADLTARQFRGQVFVDTSNTAYYMDPNSSSNFYSITVASNLIAPSETGATNTITSLTTAPIVGPELTIANLSKNYTPLTIQSSCWDYDVNQAVNAVTGVYKAGGGASGGWFCAVGGPYDYPTEAFRLMVGGNIEHSNGYINIPGSTRSPLFYDSDNTAYYANPAGTSNFNYIQGTAQYANYADLAENYLGDADYPQGTVLEFGGDQEITQSTQDMSQRIAGIVSDKPAVLMNHSLKGDFVLPLALQGRVPCRVTGIVRKGDMMVSNGDGTARAESAPTIGSIIGKALENFSGQTGIIEVVVGSV